MVLRKLSQSLRITLALMVATFSSGLLQPAVAYATTTRTNAGDTKVVDELGGSEVPNNEPILTDCDLGVEFYNFVNTTDEIATVTFEPQAPTDDVIISVTGNQSPTVPGDGDGDPNGSNDMDGAHPYSLSFTGAPKTQGAVNGYHVKVLTDVSNTNGGAKQKVFWMPASCGTTPTPSAPSVIAVAQVCKQGDVTQDVLVTVTNTDDATNEGETYEITIAGTYKMTTALIADGANGLVTFTGLPAGTHSVAVLGSDGTTASTSVTVAECTTTPTPSAPSVIAVAQVCKQGDVTQDVLVTVTNTDDATNEGETYEITIAGTYKMTTALIADGANGLVTFTGLPAGTHSVAVLGSDGTTASTSVTVAECGGRGAGICENPANGGVITQNTPGWALGGSGDKAFVDGGVELGSNNWSGAYITSDQQYLISNALQLGWTIEGTVSGAHGIAIIFKTTDGAFIHYEPEPYSDDFWTDTPGILPENAGGQGGDYSGSLQDLLDTGGDQSIVKTYFYFNSATANSIVLKSLSFNCTNFTFDKEEEQEPIADIDAVVVCATQGVKVTLTNSGDADGTATVNGTVYVVEANNSREVLVPFAIGTPFMVSIEVTVGETTVLTQSLNCTPQGNVLGEQTKTDGGRGAGQTLGATILPAVLPSTGATDSPLMILAAALLAYGAAYFLQGRRLIARKEAIGA